MTTTPEDIDAIMRARMGKHPTADEIANPHFQLGWMRAEIAGLLDQLDSIACGPNARINLRQALAEFRTTTP